jgi:hypothetical protein
VQFVSAFHSYSSRTVRNQANDTWYSVLGVTAVFTFPDTNTKLGYENAKLAVFKDMVPRSVIGRREIFS